MAVKLYPLERTSIGTSAVQILSTPIRTPGMIISAPASNTAPIYFGDSNVTTTKGAIILPAESISISCPIIGGDDEEIDISDFYVVASAATQYLHVVYFGRR